MNSTKQCQCWYHVEEGLTNSMVFFRLCNDLFRFTPPASVVRILKPIVALCTSSRLLSHRSPARNVTCAVHGDHFHRVRSRTCECS